jgi:alpha-glucosidase
MTLPGTACIYQGDEIGQGAGPGGDPPHDRVGRDAFRHPMQWDGTPRGGFSAAEPWLPVVDAAQRSVAGQREDPASLLSLWRELIALRPRLGPGLRLLEREPGAIAFERGDVVVTVNAGHEPVAAPRGEVLLATAPGVRGARSLAPGEGAVVARS